MDLNPWKTIHHRNEVEALRQSLENQGHVTTAPTWLNSEWLRLSTYTHYPRDAPCSAVLLARQGFVFIGQGHSNDITIVCVFCFTVVRNLVNDQNRSSIEKLHTGCRALSGKAHENRLIKGGDTDDFCEILSQLRHLDGKREHQSLPLGDKGPSSEDSNLPTESSNTQRHSTSTAVSEEANNTDEEHNTPASALADSTAHNRPHSPFNQANQYFPGPDPDVPTPESHPTNQLQPRHPSVDNTSRTHTSDNNALHADSHQVQAHVASSEFVTNRAQSLSLPWQRGVGSDTTNGDSDAGRSYTYSTSAQNASDSVPTADGASVSALSSDTNEGRRPPVGHGSSSQPQDTPAASQPPVEISSPSAPQTSSTSSSNNEQNQNDHESLPQDSTLSYEKLGIMTARPKRTEFAVLAVRLESFQAWPQGHHIQPLPLAQAGYFYTGYSDCARCFFCGGGLRNWEEGDDVWVEHARWFPKCTFVRQNLGQDFIDVAQDLSKEQEMIPFNDVITEMNIRGLDTKFPEGIKDDKVELERDSAVKILIEEGFIKGDLIEAADHVKKSAESVYDELVKRKAKRLVHAARKSKGVASSVVSRRKSKIRKKNQETLDSLRGAINELRQQSQCKMCMDKEVAMIFLPCGHFVSCSNCSYALKNCPICRQSIKGVVRGQLA